MNTTELLRGILNRLEKFILLIILTGIIGGGLFYFYAKSRRPVFTAKATVFPLSSASDNLSSSNALSGILGLGDAPKSFSSDAAINIIELTSSRFVRESVAASRLPAFNNKTITELLIEDQNNNRGYMEKVEKVPTDSVELAVDGGQRLKAGIVTKMSKNGVLELYFSHPNKKLISPISYILIDKVSQFYIDLKIKKATADYNFTVRKIDSLDKIINGIDRKAIHIQNTTLFAPDKLEYELPKERITSDKQRYVRQRDISLNNQEEALWRLQKLTPIISVLDKPTEPFIVSQPSAIMYTSLGFVVGFLFAALLAISGLFYKYAKYEFQSVLTPTNAPKL